MDFSANIASVVIKRVVNSNIGEVSLDSQMLNVLMHIDGVRNIGEVARVMKVDMHSLKETLQRLDRLNLIEADVATVPTLDHNFFDFLANHLSIAMGPMAEILIEDEIREIGISKDKIPTHRAAELVDILAREIPRDEKKIQFQQIMLKKLKNM
ncbi:MAG: hypothetical protein KKD44_21485 [Proteobacteria bacterium]|nr:hypothetical protein [Pseudomonadota bacterium]